MPKRTTGHQRRGQQSRGNAVSSFGAHASNLLAIPAVAPEIPGRVEFDLYGSRWAKIALLWLEAGYLTEDDEGSALDLIRTAVDRWSSALYAEMRCMPEISISVMPYPSDDGFSPGAHYAYKEESWKDKWFFGVVGGYDCPWFNLENRVTELELEHPGLGKTAVKCFQHAASSLLPIMEPDCARYMAERVWWYGMDTQEAYEEEMEVCEGDGYEADPEHFGPEAFDAKFPEWMFKNPGSGAPKLTEAELAAIAANGKSEAARQVAALTLEISQIDTQSYRLPSTFGESPVQLDNGYHLAYVRWNEADPMVQLVDDLMNEANNCSDSFTELLGADCVPLDPSGFQQWKTEIEMGFKVLKKLDELLSLISDRA